MGPVREEQGRGWVFFSLVRVRVAVCAHKGSERGVRSFDDMSSSRLG